MGCRQETMPCEVNVVGIKQMLHPHLIDQSKCFPPFLLCSGTNTLPELCFNQFAIYLLLLLASVFVVTKHLKYLL